MAQGKSPNSVYYTVEEAFNLATIRGARAAKMEAKVGSIAEGKAADLVIFSGTSPSMVAAAQHDPVAAVILHSNPNDVEYVVIDGVIRKRASKLIECGIREHDVGCRAASCTRTDGKCNARIPRKERVVECVVNEVQVSGGIVNQSKCLFKVLANLERKPELLESNSHVSI